MALGLSPVRMAEVLGLTLPGSVIEKETGRLPVTLQDELLIIAYLHGYRPADWPADTQPSEPRHDLADSAQLHR